MLKNLVIVMLLAVIAIGGGRWSIPSRSTPPTSKSASGSA